MTMIVGTNVGALVLIGDMLLSVENPQARTDLQLPSQPQGVVVPQGMAPKHIPVAARRKVLVVNDRLAAGAAGSALHIRSFLDDLAAQFRGRADFTLSDISGFLDAYAASSHGAEVLSQITAIMAVAADGGSGFRVVGTGHAYSHFRSQHFGEVVATGSGRESIAHEMRLFDRGRYRFAQPPDDDQWPEFKALARSLTVLGHVYWKEFAASFTSLESNIFSGWGGAYDCVYRDSNGVLNYLDSYTVLLRLFDVDQQDDEAGASPTHILKYERRDDVSVVATTDGHDLSFFAARDINAPDAPGYVTVGGADFTMNSRVHVVVTAVLKDGRFRSPAIYVDGLDPSQPAASRAVTTWFDEEGRLAIWFNKAFDDWLTGQILSDFEADGHG